MAKTIINKHQISIDVFNRILEKNIQRCKLWSLFYLQKPYPFEIKPLTYVQRYLETYKLIYFSTLWIEIDFFSQNTDHFLYIWMRIILNQPKALRIGKTYNFSLIEKLINFQWKFVHSSIDWFHFEWCNKWIKWHLSLSKLWSFIQCNAHSFCHFHLTFIGINSAKWII